MKNSNGVASLKLKESWREDSPWKEISVSARITPKRVITALMTFDRATGKRISAFNPHLKPRVLLAYRLWNKPDYTIIAEGK